MVVVRYLNLEEVVAEWTLAIALSLAIEGITAAVVLYAGIWNPLGILWALIVLCTFGVLVRILLPGISSTNLSLVRRRGFLLFPLLILAALGAWTVTWSYSLYTHAVGTNSTVSHTVSQAASRKMMHALTHTAKPTTPVDVVIVMDNVDQIATYDPQSDRYTAAQLFVGMMPVSDDVGVVRITSTQEPLRVLPLQSLQTGNDQARVNNVLTESSFGPVDTTPVAYFTSALKMAGNMLIAGPGSHRKIILIFTDALAFSGDPNACNSSPDAYHNWFCEVKALKQQGIVVSLVGFTTPGNKAALLPVQQFFTAQGGFVIPVVDTDNLPTQLYRAYRNLLNQA
jgi:hypothetical protein